MLQYTEYKADDTSEGSPRMMIIIFLAHVVLFFQGGALLSRIAFLISNPIALAMGSGTALPT